MAFPSVRSSIVSANTGSTDYTVTLPATISSGDLIVAMCSVDGARTIDWDSAAAIGTWTQHVNETIPTNNFSWTVQSIIAGASDGGATLNLNLSVADGACWIIYAIQDWFGTIATGVDFGAAASDSGTAPDPPSLSPSWGSADNLFVAMQLGDNASDVTAYPTNYSSNQLQEPGSLALGGVSNSYCHAGAATRELAAASDDPGAFTLGVSRVNIAATLAVRPAAPAGGASGIEVIQNYYTHLLGS